MNISTAVVILNIFFMLNQMPAKINADYDYYDDETVYPHQEHRLCDNRHCENTCANPDAANKPCPFRLCHEGYFCVAGYVRELETDQCILPSDCSPTVDS